MGKVTDKDVKELMELFPVSQKEAREALNKFDTKEAAIEHF